VPRDPQKPRPWPNKFSTNSLTDCYLHMPIGMVWIYLLLLLCVCVHACLYGFLQGSSLAFKAGKVPFLGTLLPQKPKIGRRIGHRMHYTIN